MNSGADAQMTATIPGEAKRLAKSLTRDYGRRRRTENAGHGAEEATKDASENLVDHVNVATEAVENLVESTVSLAPGERVLRGRLTVPRGVVSAKRRHQHAYNHEEGKGTHRKKA